MKRNNFLKSTILLGVGVNQGIFGSKEKNGPLKPFYIPPVVEPLISEEGTKIRLKIRTKDTNNQIGSVEFSLAPKTMGPAPHIHKDLDEIMFVHEGEVHVMVGEEVTIVKAGGYHMRPHGMSASKSVGQALLISRKSV